MNSWMTCWKHTACTFLMIFLFLSHFHLILAEKRVSCAIYVATKSLQVKCLFFSDPKTLNLSTQNVSRFPREYQTWLCYANRQLHSTNNILGAKACEQQGLTALTQSGLTCLLGEKRKASNNLTSAQSHYSIRFLKIITQSKAFDTWWSFFCNKWWFQEKKIIIWALLLSRNGSQF